ncbi:MAG: acetyl-CoA carboxylase biotin carboxyl carrier protein [Acidobacteriota bacterium]
MAKPDIEKGNTVKIQDIQKLVDMLDKSNLNEIEIEGDGMRLRLSKGLRTTEAAPSAGPSYFMVPQGGPSLPAAPAPPAPPVSGPPQTGGEAPSTGEAAPTPAARGTEIKSPMVGTFYRSPAPGAEPFVKIGDTVRKGQTLCIIEAMKLMNEIESELDGVVLDVYPENAQPVEYGERLFLIQPA